jgi:hypothetical protein
MPFPTKPPGFGSHALDLLDIALTRAWIERVATGASLSGADSATRAALWEQVSVLDALLSGRAPRTKQERKVTSYRFKVGQRVIFHPTHRTTPPSIVTILRRLPTDHQDPTYRVKSDDERCERVAKERELASVEDEAI